MNNTVKIVV